MSKYVLIFIDKYFLEIQEIYVNIIKSIEVEVWKLIIKAVILNIIIRKISLRHIPVLLEHIRTLSLRSPLRNCACLKLRHTVNFLIRKTDNKIMMYAKKSHQWWKLPFNFSSGKKESREKVCKSHTQIMKWINFKGRRNYQWLAVAHWIFRLVTDEPIFLELMHARICEEW